MPLFEGWTVQRKQGSTLVRPPSGHAPALTPLTITEHCRPLAPLRTLLAERIGPRPNAAVSVERVTTSAGEYGALVVVADAPTQILGVLYGDDFQTLLEATVPADRPAEPMRALVREVIQHLPLGLGQGRHRRFFYRPPRGWHPVVRGLQTEWLAPDYPRVSARLVVLPARPVHQTGVALRIDNLLHDDVQTFGLEQPIEHKLVEHPTLKGVLARALGRFPDGPRLLHTTCALEDGRYLYVARLTSAVAVALAYEPVLLDMVASFEPLPTMDLTVMAASAERWKIDGAPPEWLRWIGL